MRTLVPIDPAGAPAGAPSAFAGSPKPSRRAAASWLAPDLALTGAFVAMVWLLVVFGGPSALFRDADAGWHIRAGDLILTSRALPHADPFSFSKPAEPWIAWEWASDVFVAVTHRAAGLPGVAWLYALAIAAGVWMWFRLHWVAGGNFILACLFASPMLSTANLHWLARPHIFGWLFALGTVWLCEKRPSRVNLALVAAFSALWANMHGSFLLGPAILLIYALGARCGKLLWGDLPRTGSGLLSAAAVSAAATLANPHGWNLHRHVFAYLTDSGLLDRIGEFQSFNFHAPGAFQIALMLLICAAGAFAALTAHRFDRFLLSLAMTAAALRSARMLPLAALLLLPIANGSISAALTNARLASRPRRLLDRILDYGLGLRTLDRNLGGLALLPLAALLLFGVMHALRPTFPPDQFPVAASSATATLPAGARLFASDKFGGYLIYRFRGQRKVFFDGRSDFYGAAFLSRYARIVQARPGWQSEFSRWNFTHALLPPDSSLLAALETQGWTELFRDHTAVLLVNKSEVAGSAVGQAFRLAADFPVGAPTRRIKPENRITLRSKIPARAPGWPPDRAWTGGLLRHLAPRPATLALLKGPKT